MTADLPRVPIHERLGITVSEASVESVVGSLPVAGNEQPFGALHGGASVVLAESLASIGSALHAAALYSAGGHGVVGIEVNATHHRAVTSGTVTGRATPQHLGRRVATWQVELRDGSGRLTCTARVTCLITDQA